MLLTRDCHFTTVNLPLVGKKKKNRNPFERWTFKLFKNSKYRRRDERYSEKRTNMKWRDQPESHANLYNLAIAEEPSFRHGSWLAATLCTDASLVARVRGSAYFLPFNPALISLSSTEDAFFSRDEPTASAYACKHTEIICRYFLAQIRSNWPSVNFHPLMNFNFAKGISYCIFSLCK